MERADDSDEGQTEDVKKAKQYLKKQEDFSSSSLWDLLCSVVNKLLVERRRDAYQTLENTVRSIKLDNTEEEHPQIVPLTDIQLEHAKLMKGLLTRDAEWFVGAPQPPPWSEVIEQMSLLNRLAGITMPEETVLQLSVSTQRLVQAHPHIKRARFWGVVCGRYFVLETELTEAGYSQRRELIEAAEREAAAKEAERKAEEERAKKEEDSDRLSQDKIELQKNINVVAQPPPVPTEPPGSGTNRMVYWVSLELGCPETWYALPDVTPLQISIARSAICLFTGLLNAKVRCWPAFPGDEGSMLRAQIARISASTLVAPAGYFRARPRRAEEDVEPDEDSEEEDEEESDEDEEIEKEAVVNSRYRPPSTGTLLQPSSWVHYRPHILQQQARTKWWNPNPDAEDEEEEEEESDAEAGDKGSGPERGPKLMSPLGSDRSEPALVPGIHDCWALRDLGAGATLASSLIWPGAVTLTVGRCLEHVYIGWGWKSSNEGWSPASPPPSANEPPDLQCVIDPTPAEEAAAQPEPEDEDEGEDEESD